MSLENFIKQHEEKAKRLSSTQPAAIGEWTDHRPIGVAFYADVAWRTDKNPRGWNPFWYQDLDVKDPDFLTKFETKFKGFEEANLQRAKNYGCQGRLGWDIEGQHYDPWTTYLGDCVECLPPEMTQKLIKWAVDSASKLGMWSGFTIRPTIAPIFAHGNPQQFPAGIYANNIIWKMQIYNSTYGPDVKCAYVDSNVQVNAWVDGTAKAFQSNVMAEVQANKPGWLLIPEFTNVNYDKVPRVVPIKWPTVQAASYPQFVMPKVIEGEPDQATKDEFYKAFKAGGIAALTATWDAPWDKWLLAEYKRAIAPSV
jgi:hypothetical protein